MTNIILTAVTTFLVLNINAQADESCRGMYGALAGNRYKVLSSPKDFNLNGKDIGFIIYDKALVVAYDIGTDPKKCYSNDKYPCECSETAEGKLCYRYLEHLWSIAEDQASNPCLGYYFESKTRCNENKLIEEDKSYAVSWCAKTYLKSRETHTVEFRNKKVQLNINGKKFVLE